LACLYKKERVRLFALQNFTSCTPNFWSGQVSTPKKLEWTSVHSILKNILECTKYPLHFFKKKLNALQIITSGTPFFLEGWIGAVVYKTT
jgi:hypothetical protein